MMSSARVPEYKLPAFPKGERTASTRTTLVETVAVFMALGYSPVTYWEIGLRPELLRDENWRRVFCGLEVEPDCSANVCAPNYELEPRHCCIEANGASKEGCKDGI